MTLLPAKRSSLIWVMILLQALSSNHFCIGESTSPIIVNDKEAPAPKNKQEVGKIKGEVSQLLTTFLFFKVLF